MEFRLSYGRIDGILSVNNESLSDCHEFCNWVPSNVYWFHWEPDKNEGTIEYSDLSIEKTSDPSIINDWAEKITSSFKLAKIDKVLKDNENENTIDLERPYEEQFFRLRNALLEKSDWTQLIDAPLSDSKKQEWQVYRQNLRDLPESIVGFDLRRSLVLDQFHPLWPSKPS